MNTLIDALNELFRIHSKVIRENEYLLEEKEETDEEEYNYGEDEDYEIDCLVGGQKGYSIKDSLDDDENIIFSAIEEEIISKSDTDYEEYYKMISLLAIEYYNLISIAKADYKDCYKSTKKELELIDVIEKADLGELIGSISDLENLRKCIIHNDADIVVFNKPAGLAVQGGTGIKKSIDKMAAALFPYDKISLVHRIDRETSGLLVVAKNQKSAQDLANQFQNKIAHKEYLALLQGNVTKKSGVIENYVAKGQVFEDDTKIPQGTSVQRAITEYEVLGEAAGMLTWMLFSPKTGRTHQLRLHSAFSLKAPIVGDDLYGDRHNKLDGVLGSLLTTQKLFLFAYRITFRHPGTGKTITLRADVPDFMQSVIKFLEFKLP